MKIEQIYTGCLSQGAYFISSNGEAAVIDPLRETKPYIERAQKENLKIKYVFETHFHADFVSGHVDLASKTGATIVFGPGAVTSFSSHVAKDNEEFWVGKVRIRLLHTPGHTQESSTYLLFNEEGKEHCIFTGDTLFIGDVGRPDLAVSSALTQEDLAGLLYDSLRNKIMNLPPHLIVYPAHGAGSACGKNLSKETFDTLENQLKVNYALQPTSRENFIRELTTGILPPPKYFPKNAALNKNGYSSYESVVKKGNNPLSPEEFERLTNESGALVLDVRKNEEFSIAHIPNSIFIGLDGQFAPWVGALIPDLQQPILLVTPEGREEETIMRLSRVGYDNSIGFLKGGIQEWKNSGREISSLASVTAEELKHKLENESLKVLDVRKPGEHDAQHLAGAENKPLDYINDWTGNLDKNESYFVHCAGGYRSVIAVSILKARGFEKLIDVKGGFAAMQKAGIPTTTFVCPSGVK
jgi:hydroxyacylglutathione hydrolase